MKRTAVVILNWNGRSLMEQFLPSLCAYTHYPEVELIVADNASSDDSRAWLKSSYPSIRQIELPENYGFARGYNEALKQVEAEYVVLLNSDVELTANWLPPLIEFLEAHPSHAAVQPKIRAQRQKSHFEYAGAAGGYIDILGFPFCRGRIFDSCEEDQGQYETIQDVFWASGACLCIRKSVYDALDGLDADFFAHMEEIDLCWRIHNSGMGIACVPHSLVYHVGGASLEQGHPRKIELNFRNNLFMLFKNLPLPMGLLIIYLRMCLDGVAGIQYLLQGKLAAVIAILKAHFQFYLSIPHLLQKRKQKQYLKPTALSGLYRGSIVWQYFVRGIKKYSDLPFDNK